MRAIRRPETPAAGVDAPVAAAGVPALVRGVLVIRWAVVAWMLVVLADAVVTGAHPGVPAAAVALAVVAGWVGWLTVAGPHPTPAVLGVDLLVAAAMVVVGARLPWFATVYPVTAALAWGAARGVRGGLSAGGVLGAVSVAAAATAGGDASRQLIAVLRDPVNLLLAGGGLGFVATLLERSAAQVRAAQRAEVRATERAARATERESLGRQIHDSVLQTLALVHKRGRELATREQIDGAEVGRLAELAAAQERTLRALILRPPDADEPDDARVPLRERLDRAADEVIGTVATSVTTAGDIRLPAACVHEVGAAVDQALRNVVRHADAQHAWIFAEVVDDALVVSVRDDGRGFSYDPEHLRSAGKFGLLRSIRGRIEDLGGAVRIDTAPGRGTELELRVPVPATDAPAGGRR